MKGYFDLRTGSALLIGAAAFMVACGDASKSAATADSTKRQSAEITETGSTGKTIVVEAYSDEKGNYFKPNKLEAHKGDVVRFVLKSGVHNVNFLADSNAGRTGLPPASDMLQLPDQTYDVKVTFGEGHYYFQCDPHAALGMIGHLEVED